MDTIVGLLGGFILGIPLTLLGSYYAFVLQRRRKELGWEVLSSEPVVTRPKGNSDVRISVRGELLGLSTEEWEEIEALRAVRVRLRNTGNEVIDGLAVRFEFAEGARAISVQPESRAIFGEQQATSRLQEDSPRTATAVLPFLNPKGSVIFNLQAVNTDDSSCVVTAAAPGLVFYALVARRYLNNAFIYAGLALVALALGSAILILNWQAGLDLKGPNEQGEDAFNDWGGVMLVSYVASIVLVGGSLACLVALRHALKPGVLARPLPAKTSTVSPNVWPWAR